MTTYIISYDLIKNKDYASLVEAIKSQGAWAKILESVRAVVSSKSATQLRDELARKMDGDDKLFVIKSGREAARTQVLCDAQRLIDRL